MFGGLGVGGLAAGWCGLWLRVGVRGSGLYRVWGLGLGFGV